MSANVVGKVAELGRNIGLPPYCTLAEVRERLVEKSDRLTCCLKHPGDGCEGEVLTLYDRYL